MHSLADLSVLSVPAAIHLPLGWNAALITLLGARSLRLHMYRHATVDNRP
jgi:hypothetical protein